MPQISCLYYFMPLVNFIETMKLLNVKLGYCPNVLQKKKCFVSKIQKHLTLMGKLYRLKVD